MFLFKISYFALWKVYRDCFLFQGFVLSMTSVPLWWSKPIVQHITTITSLKTTRRRYCRWTGVCTSVKVQSALMYIMIHNVSLWLIYIWKWTQLAVRFGGILPNMDTGGSLTGLCVTCLADVIGSRKAVFFQIGPFNLRVQRAFLKRY